MQSVKQKNTKPELMVRSLIHGQGLRFRLHCKGLPGKPDIVLPKHRVIIFVQGCFWHQHANCKRATLPQTRTEFWTEKLVKNKQRDRKVQRELRQMGWQVAVVWECQTKDADCLLNKLARYLPIKRGGHR